MKIQYIFILLSLILSVAFGIEVYVSEAGNDESYCGQYVYSPCQTIDYAIKKAMSTIESQYLLREINVNLLSGQYNIQHSLNLYGYSVTLSRYYPYQAVSIGYSSYHYNAMFHINAYSKINTLGFASTSFKVEDIVISNCYVDSSKATLLEINDGNYSVPIHVELNNVQFSCQNIYAPFISYTGESYSNSEDLSLSSSSSSSSSNEYDATKTNTYNYYSSSSSSSNDYNLTSSSSSDNNNNNNFISFSDNQSFGNWPEYGYNMSVTFKFNNIKIVNGYCNSDIPLLLNVFNSRNPVQIYLSDSSFPYIYASNFINAESASVNFNNVHFPSYSGNSGGGFLNFEYSKVSFNNVSLQGVFYSSNLLNCVDCIFIANQFNLAIQMSNYGVYDFMSFTNSFVTIENSNHTIVSSNQNPSTSIYGLTKSNLALFSNLISVGNSPLFQLSKSSINVNRNNLMVFSTLDYSSINLCTTNIDLNTKVSGDEFFVFRFNNDCYGPSSFTPSTVERYYLLLAFFVGVFTITIFFIIAYTISAICKCKRRNNKRNQYKQIVN
ncbi:hypothetical protein DICPUDRAFT_98013 [Dictyostelium purpureum]|uniref:Transmembrane protein n=1 Tax=Dictyostelium purpureum TaxID=5786 RepID=F0ZLV7_DICPU|nr:uncharacterized protein DICPUDRAFT_98013 [Dictyostelium purpureum]EGC35082.1 hypothetical protein DICPUDRAFT_98013 [Dictyostelium purpureum]|eukprot:XP_003288389.1 hypothetical protein DICPUDRAFT_98013 [Dictyostelium purpureum]